uniref:hypothetical protein n=1 Tax=Streptobacillus felis TaxID=1384509 RepID=UPI000B16848A
ASIFNLSPNAFFKSLSLTNAPVGVSKLIPEFNLSLQAVKSVPLIFEASLLALSSNFSLISVSVTNLPVGLSKFEPSLALLTNFVFLLSVKLLSSTFNLATQTSF